MIEIYLLEQLDAFAHNGTLTKASEELHISQPALSHSMKKLEAETGMSLFSRDGKRMTLTETGEIAARYASRILSDEREMLDQMAQKERSLRSIVLGSCAPMPIARLIPVLQMLFPDKSVITEMRDSDDVLLQGLRNRTDQLAILHEKPKEAGIFYQRYVRESICLYVPESHPLARRQSVTLKEISGMRIVAHRHIGFWLKVCERAIPKSNLLIQDSMDAMDELAESSTIAMFNSDAMIIDGFEQRGRVAVPISDPEMTTTYYVACLDSEKEKYRSFFSSVRAEAMRAQGHEASDGTASHRGGEASTLPS
ncbi:MAG: LysR family transcriptional regulator [Tractidigestivibacter sp.]|jgi:DNA-binding transcriptional LysR family regulator|uniref:LysR family transcriptional regulator n=1 Tax=Tractidigestivibacter sp. TaxID=2847320 RepID=UPI003D8DCE01